MKKSLKLQRYIVRFNSCSNLEINKRFDFQERDFFIAVRENKRYAQDNPDYPSQLIIDVIIEGETLYDVIDKGKRVAETILGMISCSVSCFTDLCQFDRAINFSDGINDREFVQNIYYNYNISLKRELKPEIFSIFHKKLVIARKKESQNYINKISRSFRWYRKGLIEQELFDQFINFWTGLECIKDLLNAKYSNKTKVYLRKCPNCGFEYEVPSSEGIKYLLTTKLGFPDQIWRELRETRTSIIHGYRPLNEISPKAIRLLPFLQRALLFGLLDLLEFTEEEKQKLLRVPYYYTGRQNFQISCTFKQVDKKLIDIDNFPKFEIENIQLMQSKDDKKASNSIKVKISLPNFKENYSDLKVDWQMKIDPEKTDTKMEIIIT